MAWQFKIGEGGTQVVISEPAGEIPGGFNFQELLIAAIKPNGDTESTDRTFNIVGDLEETVTQTLEDSKKVLSDLVEAGTAVRIQLLRDGTVIPGGDFLPADFVGTPKVIEFETLSDEGGGESHWPYRLKIWMRKAGISGGTPQTTITIRRSIRVVKFKKVTTQKIWAIDVTAKTLADAVSIVNSKKPNIEPLDEDITRNGDANQAIAVWTWNAADGTTVEFVENVPRIKRGGRRHVIRKLTGKRKPVAHRARQGEAIVTLSGTISRVAGTNGQKPIVNPPDAHLTESPTVIRLDADGGDHLGEPIAVDKLRGIFQRAWEEKYVVLENISPIVKHGDHNKAFADTPAKEPPDGPFFS